MKIIRNTLVAALVMVTPLHLYSADLLKANTLFSNQQYAEAFAQYQQGAKLGSAHAYYQLGVMYSKGLGVSIDQLNALIYFSLAAQHNYHDARKVFDTMVSKLPESQKSQVKQLLKDYQLKQEQITQQYTPVINQANLANKITFAGKPNLESKVYLDDLEDELGISQIDLSSIIGDEESDSDSSVISVKEPFLILEHEVARDGSIRNIQEVQKIGSASRFIDAYKLFPLAQPEFNGTHVEFVHRAYIGAAIYDQFKIIEERPQLYREIRRIVKTAQKSQSLQDQHQYAVAMLNFPWLEKEPDQAEKLLKKLALQGHPAAMYDYGLKLYREQKQIPEAIKWITEASKYGLTRAEYRLARLIQTSPWLEHDESKALFWYQLASAKGHATSTLRIADIRMTAKDKNLRDVSSAIEHLQRIKDVAQNNPEYFYVLALTYKDRKNRDFKQVVENLEQAIRMARRGNWDVTAWEGLLAELTTGRVTIRE